MKKWALTKKNKIRYYRKMFINSYSTLSRIFTDDYLWHEIGDRYLHNDSYFKKSFSYNKRLSSKKLRKLTKNEIHNLLYKKNLDEDVFPIVCRNIRWNYY